MYRFMLYATNVSTVFQFCKEGNYDTAWKMVIGRSVSGLEVVEGGKRV